MTTYAKKMAAELLPLHASAKGGKGKDGVGFEANVFVCCAGLMSAAYWISRLLPVSGGPDGASLLDFISCGSSFIELFGILSLMVKISWQNSVAGLSAKTMIVHAGEYVLRLLCTIDLSGESGWSDLLFVGLYVLSLAMVLRVLYCAYGECNSTYWAEEDSFPVHYLILFCMVMPLLLEADVGMGSAFRDYIWNVCMWMETLALVPQVFMISKARVEIDAHVSHFVAATALSRAFDLIYWYFASEMVAPVGGAMSLSAVLIVFCHVAHALILADFMYYYLKFRLSGKGCQLLTAMPLPEEFCMV